MARFSTHDLSRIRELEGELATVTDGGPPASSWMIGALRELLGAEKAFVCGYSARGDGIAVDSGFTDGVDPELLVFADRWLADKTIGWTTYNPLRPEPAQRNVALSFSDVTAVTGLRDAPVLSEVYARFGLLTDDNLRVLVCDGPSLLAYVTFFQGGLILPVQKRLLTRLVPAVRRRLSVERLLQTGTGMHGILLAALEEISAPAFVLDDAGALLEANSVGAEWLATEVVHKRRILREAVRREGQAAGPFRVTRVASTGVAPRFLVVSKAPPSTPQLCGAAARRWRFSPREAAVLALLAEGLTNRAIAAQLEVSERSVESWLTSMFEKAQVESRAELIVAALRGGGG